MNAGIYMARTMRVACLQPRSLIPVAVLQVKARGFVALVQESPGTKRLAMQPVAPTSGVKKSTSYKEEAPKVAPSEKWKQLTVDQWRDAVYINQSYFGDLIQDTTEFVRTIAEHVKLGGKRVSLVEVGCGTGEFVRSLVDDFRTVVGVDFNEEFVNFCREQRTPRHLGKSHYLTGDATHLYSLLKSEFPKTPPLGARGVELWDDTRVVACVGNTIGIIPDELRGGVYEQMAEVAGNDGILVMVYWNARWFGDACLNFYHANPQLCGPFDGSAIDLASTTLSTPSQYRTHWTSVEEARHVMEKLGMEVICLKEKGKGVFVAARRF